PSPRPAWPRPLQRRAPRAGRTSVGSFRRPLTRPRRRRRRRLPHRWSPPRPGCPVPPSPPPGRCGARRCRSTSSDRRGRCPRDGRPPLRWPVPPVLPSGPGRRNRRPAPPPSARVGEELLSPVDDRLAPAVALLVTTDGVELSRCETGQPLHDLHGRKAVVAGNGQRVGMGDPRPVRGRGGGGT